MEKIKRLSAIFKVLFQIGFILQPVAEVFYWLNYPNAQYASNHFFIGGGESGFAILHAITLQDRLLALSASFIPLAISMTMLVLLIKLFDNFSKGLIFNPVNISRIKHISYLLFASQLFVPIHQALLSIILTMGNPPGRREILISLNADNLTMIISAFIILMIAWIMAEAYKIYEEQEFTV